MESTPGVCGGEPCIVGTRIPVWALEQARRLGINEADLLRAYPTLHADDGNRDEPRLQRTVATLQRQPR